ncbi:MAG TPA: DUF1697 domain-containing protein [Polyangiaceae bacterium]|jgi:uncharacterized protein (DUF1697 family)|nr:DUF1697 domain-containing protein [Polyangiaceae bacterium]
MAGFVALLRAINVGGTGKLSMVDLRRLCEKEGFRDVSTYIQSGNVVFTSALSEAKVKDKLEKALAKKLGKPVGVLLRSGAELSELLKHNPFKTAPTNRVVVLFLEDAPAKGALSSVVSPGREELKLKGRDLFIHYPDGQGKSKLKLPFFKTGTARNLNTVAKLADMAHELESSKSA